MSLFNISISKQAGVDREKCEQMFSDGTAETAETQWCGDVCVKLLRQNTLTTVCHYVTLYVKLQHLNIEKLVTLSNIQELLM